MEMCENLIISMTSSVEILLFIHDSLFTWLRSASLACRFMHAHNCCFRGMVSLLKDGRGNAIALPTNKAMRAGIKEDFFLKFSQFMIPPPIHTRAHTHTHARTHSSDRCTALKGSKQAPLLSSP
uniref:Uncharacterized protein n=1 Tax=Rousettus aegyptiacus TaxID=9407 RepID=A0A7J8C294_ROUAE|nr:hypothetical protein HJG63_009303 [Rousettus aegyptiacus]